MDRLIRDIRDYMKLFQIYTLNRVCSNAIIYMISRIMAIGVARKKGEDNNAESIALYVIHSEIKHAYSTYYGGSVNQSSIERIIEHAKKEAQTWFDKVQE